MSEQEKNVEAAESAESAGPAGKSARAGQPRRALPALGQLITGGARAVTRYKGLFITLYLVQLVIAGLVAWTASKVLATVFAHSPVFDQAVAGDLASLIFVITDQLYVFASILFLALGAVLGYAILSWYLIGGLNAVLLTAPDKRGEVARCFGAGGARTFYAYVRLFLLSLVPYGIIASLFLFGLSSAADDLAYGLTFGDVAAAVLPKLSPALFLLLIHLTVLDYARIELSRTIGLASRHAFFRAYKTVLTDWRPLAHVLTYIAFFALVSTIYIYATQGHAMAGALGAIALFVIRQLFLVVRYLGKMTCASGQIVYANQRASDDRPRQRLPVMS
jgi:hypothetical protein